MADRNLIKYILRGIKLVIITLLFTQIQLSAVWAIDPLSRKGVVPTPQKQEKQEATVTQEGYELPDIPPPPEVSRMIEKKKELKEEVIQRKRKQELVIKEKEKLPRTIVVKKKEKQLAQGDDIIAKNHQEKTALPAEKRSSFPLVLIVVLLLIALGLALHIHWSSR